MMLFRYFSGVAVILWVVNAAATAQQPNAAFDRGAALYRAGSCQAAITELQPAVASNPKSNLILGRCYLESKQYAKAIEILANYRKIEPNSIEAATLFAEAQDHDGHAQEAANLLEGLLKQNPDEVALRIALATLYARNGQPAKAMEQYHAVIGQQSANPAARIGLGELALREKRWQEAIDEFEQAQTVVPKDFRMLSGLGTAYMQMGNCNLAVNPLRQGLDLATDNFELAKMLATCYAASQRWKELLAALRTGTAAEAGDEEATAMVVKAFAEVNDPPAAEAYYRHVLSTSPENVTAHTALGDLLYAAKRMPEARTEYLQVVKLHPDSPRIHERLGDMADVLKDSAEARAHFEAASKSKDGSDSSRMKLALLCFGVDDLACASSTLDAISSPALGRNVRLLRVQIEYKQHHWEQTDTLATQLLSEDPQNLLILQIAGEVAAHQNRPSDASILLERALDLDPANKSIRYRLAAIYSNNDELNHAQRAVDILQEYLTKYQQDAEAYLLLGNAYRKLNDMNNAKTNFKAGFDRITPPVPPSLSWAFASYGYMMSQEEQYEEAYVYLTRAVQLNPSDQLSLYNFGVSCLALGRTDELNDSRAKLEKLNSPLLADLDQQIEAKKKGTKTKTGK